ncbi:MAG: M23 family metallopeptidase [Chthoniobacterales bacterium]
MVLSRRVTRALLIFALLIITPLARAGSASERLDLALPTDNTAIFKGGGAAFYQHVARDYQGVKSTPWQGGQYGFVRNPLKTAAGLIYTRFHEGIDIRPLRRDGNGDPLDEVRAIANGKVVHVNLVPGFSSYGKYVVIEHRWDGASYYSLYGHLASVTIETGRTVARGERVGIMGYTGEGLDQSRAHVHLELNLLLSRRFESWHEHFFKEEPNRHGIYNGINLAAIDIARLYLALRKRPSLTLPEFLSDEETFYKVKLPAVSSFDLPERYPWLAIGSADSPAVSWEISFTRSGVPLKVVPAETPIDAPVLSYIKKAKAEYSYLTRAVVSGTNPENAHLSVSGTRLMRLLIWPE